MVNYEIYWEDLTPQAQERLSELYHSNLNLTPLCVVCIDDDVLNEELSERIEEEGELIERYPVDESQVISNAGDAEIYKWKGKKYEIITWNSYASEHTPHTKTLNRLEE